MKSKTKLLLATTLIASSVLLVGCNEKNSNGKQNAANQEQTQNVKDQALQLFNMSVRIIPENRLVAKDKKGNDIASFTYTVENISNKPIKEVQWFNILSFDSAIIDLANIPATFDKPLQPNTKESVTLTKLAVNYPENVRKIVLNPENKLESKTLAGRIIFEDNSTLIVTTAEDVIHAFSKTDEEAVNNTTPTGKATTDNKK